VADVVPLGVFAVFETRGGGLVLVVPAMMLLATLLPQIRTSEALLIRQMCVAGSLIGFSTTMAILAKRAGTIHSQRWLMKQRIFAQNAAKLEIDAVGP